MKNDELESIANEFINSWQENFTKALADRQVTTQMMQVFERTFSNMQQFYEKPTSSAIPNPFESGTIELYRGLYGGRIDELEARIEALEAKLEQLKNSNKKRSKK